MPAIELKDVSKSYPEGESARVVLNGVSATFERGELAVLLGRSGSGKSTLLNLVSGMDLATQGEVRVLGHDLARMSEAARTLLRRRSIGFVFQAFNLIPTLTVEENVLLPLELNGPLTPAARARARGLLEELGLGNRATTYPDRLSGGEQQRVALIRAVVHSPELVLADEPTGNLDDTTAEGVMTQLESLTRRQGSAVVVVTHDVRFAQRAQRTYHLEGGSLK